MLYLCYVGYADWLTPHLLSDFMLALHSFDSVRRHRPPFLFIGRFRLTLRHGATFRAISLNTEVPLSERRQRHDREPFRKGGSMTSVHL